ncbi:hypothetical protein F7U82_23165 [Vibrio parahaemolyticus]|nr:hypothetical protein [Vibrio parahaemolyticus]
MLKVSTVMLGLLTSLNSYAGEWSYSPLSVDVPINETFIPDINGAVKIMPATLTANPGYEETLFTVNITVPQGVTGASMVPVGGVKQNRKVIGSLTHNTDISKKIDYYLRSTGGAILLQGEDGIFPVNPGKTYTFKAANQTYSNDLKSGTYSGSITVAFYAN